MTGGNVPESDTAAGAISCPGQRSERGPGPAGSQDGPVHGRGAAGDPRGQERPQGAAQPLADERTQPEPERGTGQPGGRQRQQNSKTNPHPVTRAGAFLYVQI